MTRLIIAVSVGLILLVPFAGTIQCLFVSFAHNVVGATYEKECSIETFDEIASRLEGFVDGFKSAEQRMDEMDGSLSSELRNRL